MSSSHVSVAARSGGAGGGARRVRRRAPPQRTTSNTRAWNVQNRIEIESALRLLLLAAEPGVRIERVCLLDHSSPGYRPRHLHVQCIFTDGSFSVWLTVDGTVPTLREALRAVQPGRVRIHVHEELEEEEEEEAPNGGAASARTVAALPCLTLEKRSADRLAADGIDACPFCLEGFVTGDEVLCMPCPGKHIAHAPCMHQWLQIASTCPSCRFMLPHGLPSSELHTLIDPARSELTKLRLTPRTSSVTCGECQTDDDDITTSMPTAAGAAGGAPGSSGAGGLPMDTAREGDKFDKFDAPKQNVTALYRPEFDYRTAAEAVASASASAMAAAAAASAAAAARAEPYRDRFIAAAAAAAASLDEAQSAEAREVAELHELLRSGSQSPRHLSTSALYSGGVSAVALAASSRSNSSSSSSSIALPAQHGALPTPPPLMPPPLHLPYSLSPSPTTVVQFSRTGPAVVTQYNSPSTAPRLSTAPPAARTAEPSRLRLPRMSWGRRAAPN